MFFFNRVATRHFIQRQCISTVAAVLSVLESLSRFSDSGGESGDVKRRAESWYRENTKQNSHLNSVSYAHSTCHPFGPQRPLGYSIDCAQANRSTSFTSAERPAPMSSAAPILPVPTSAVPPSPYSPSSIPMHTMQSAPQQYNPYRPNGGFAVGNQHNTASNLNCLSSEELPQSSRRLFTLPYRQSIEAHHRGDRRFQTWSGAVPSISYQSPQPSPPLIGSPPLCNFIRNTFHPHTSQPNLSMFDFNSSLSHAPRPSSSRAAILLQQQHQPSPLIPVLDMLSQQMQDPASQGSMGPEAGSTHDVPRRLRNRGKK
ncbi:hypothetical protein TSMEX_005886 [Taenia solium]|eukprot:TsM_001060600 transcript=TsM_001060600 gene=TsM_001060600